jgi:hypothetical protein
MFDPLADFELAGTTPARDAWDSDPSRVRTDLPGVRRASPS